MSRYFFHVFDNRTKNLVRDLDGASFPNVRQAKQEAIDFARDLAGHQIHPSTWQVLVTDQNGDLVLKLPLSQIRTERVRPWLDRVHRAATYEPRFKSRLFTWLLVAAMLAMVTQASLLTQRLSRWSVPDRITSMPAEGAIVLVRFVPRASVAEVANLLAAYNASLVGGPRPNGTYRLRVANAALPDDHLAKIVSSLAHEKIIAFAAAAR